MGEMADYYIDNMPDEWPRTFSDAPPFRVFHTCRHCGRRGLEWGLAGPRKHRDQKWVLCENGARHVCVFNDFEKLDK